MIIIFCCECNADTEHNVVEDDVFGEALKCEKCKTVWEMEEDDDWGEDNIDWGKIMISMRINRLGLTYYIHHEPGSNKCLIKMGEKELTIDHDFDRVSQAWYDWQVKGWHIQKAFYFLTDGEREFLLSGITPGEWDKIFLMIK